MPIETNCPGCGRLLRVADEHAGWQARCPECNTIYVVPDQSAAPAEDAAPADAAAPAADDRWYMKTPERQVYGPVSRGELERWLSQGRISADCELRADEDAPWRPASEYFAQLQPGAVRAASPFSPGAATTSGASVSRAPARGTLVPHRGPLILLLGILGWFTCPILGIVAWAMGSSDLREMQYGRMDPSGQGLTQAGQILGIISSVIWILVIMFSICAGILSAVA